MIYNIHKRYHWKFNRPTGSTTGHTNCGRWHGRWVGGQRPVGRCGDTCV